MSDSIGGFAARRKDTCGSLKTCGGIIADTFFACCPEGTECLRESNTFCCPEGVDDCQDELNENPRCADPDWPMFNNPNGFRSAGYFCCEGDLRGYNATGKGGSNGCAREDSTIGKNDEWLDLEVQAKVTPSPSATPEPSPDDDDGPPIGAIVGGTVGGVAALAILVAAVWWFRRRKRHAPAVVPAEDEYKTPVVPMPPGELEGAPAGGGKPKELPGDHGASELPA